jgi:glycosyltransferase involved in cell wall biosynthesis
MRYFFEGQQGVSAARNKAVAEARGDYVSFLDDECTVSPDWLSIAIFDIEQYNPHVIGGPYIGAFLPGDRPKWFKIEYGNAPFLECDYDRGFQDDFLASSGNMFARRSIFDTLKFDINLGPKGKRLGLHEETDLQRRFLRAKPSEKIFYEPRIVVRHFVLPEKMGLLYRAKRQFVSALTSPSNVDVRSLFIALSKTMIHSTFGPVRLIWRDRSKYPYWQNVAYERTLPGMCFNAGIVAKCLRNQFLRS